MEQQSARLRNTGFLTFFFSGICAISAGVVVSLLQERYGFAYGMTGTLLSLMSVGNLLAGLLIGMLPSVLGMKPSVLSLTPVIRKKLKTLHASPFHIKSVSAKIERM